MAFVLYLHICADTIYSLSERIYLINILGLDLACFPHLSLSRQFIAAVFWQNIKTQSYLSVNLLKDQSKKPRSGSQV